MQWLGKAKFIPADPENNREMRAEKFVLKQGAIETSNTSLVNEMIGMINVTRGYETLSKFLKEESTLLSKAIQVGRVSG